MTGAEKAGAREAGVLLSLASLPAPHGVGDMGGAARRFAELLAGAGVRYWQILPLNPLGYGNSPYQPYSSFAGDPLYISLDALYGEGLLASAPRPFQRGTKSVAYSAVRSYKEGLLREAFRAFTPGEAFEAFAAQAWVFPYAVFMAFKRANSLRCWNMWPDAQKNWPADRAALDLAPFDEDIRFEMFAQYVFYTQWMALKRYANSLGVQIIGDIPIYVGIDSLDVWAGRENFLLDEKGEPLFVAGVPPDYFSAEGQRWGNPIYDWARLRADGFRFWIDRMRYSGELFDVVRIDHFRGFDTYWKIPAACPTAVEGEWVEAPGYALFDAVLAAAPGLTIIAEDLGMLREEVHALRDHYGFRGMDILQFTVDPAKPLTVGQGNAHRVVYTGTHDNQTIRGWFESQRLLWRLRLRARLLRAGYWRGPVWEKLARLALDSAAEMVILPLADCMGLSDEARINTPGTVGPPNWEWKLAEMAEMERAMPGVGRLVRESGRG
ncbi:MAG: 4-alpha-glucanotransferase [Firmicutes bacterium]|nr:4-alpha-glucanotransferase [Bacillota bacterium]